MAMSDTRAVEAASASVSSPIPSFDDKTAGPVLKARFRHVVPMVGREFALQVEVVAAPGFTILFGASGAGKTTLLDCVAGLARPESGRIAVGKHVLFDSDQRVSLPVAKRRVGYVFQNLALFPHLTVEQNVEYGLAHLPKAERVQRS
jgi:ABC-type molybdate transport system ATPase subunit